MKRFVGFYICACLLFSNNLVAKKKALIYGITGQDGAYLTELLLEKGYEVHGVKRRSSSHNTARIDKFYEGPQQENRNFILYYGDITDTGNIMSLIARIVPDEIYNLAAQSHVRVSFDLPVYTSQVDGLGTLRILEAIRYLGYEKKIKFYQASTSELYGLAQENIQSETTPFYPRSPYGCAKLFSYWITKNYREAYGIFTCNGILFNHESPLRGQTFVTRKITQAACRIKLGLQDLLYLGNLDAIRDWGHARDYVEAMYLMLQQEKPDDYVIATGETHSVREFVEIAFHEVGYKIVWHGQGINEVGVDKISGKELVRIDPRYFRPTEVDFLKGDASKAREVLNWKPKTPFKQLVSEMIKEDMKEAIKQQMISDQSSF